MSLLALGINHKTAPVKIREQLSFAPDTIPDALSDLIAQDAVNEAVIFDSEGLVVGMVSGDEFDAESFSAFTLLMLDQINHVLKHLNENPVQTLIIKSNESWLTLERIDNLILIVKAKSETDELLKVRIGQAVEMIKTYLSENYPLLSR